MKKVKQSNNFEPYQYSVTDRSHGIVMPSYRRMSVAVTVTVVIMVVCAVFVSVFGRENISVKKYYPTGNAESVPVYDYSDVYDGLTVIGESLQITSFTQTVVRGEWATLRILGKPNTEYGITVYLKSGPSGNSALIPKISDSNGYVEWKWKIYKGTSIGKFRIVIKSMRGDNVCISYAETYLTITE